MARFAVETRWGGSEEDPSPQRLSEVLGELEAPDEEHPDTWLTHYQSGWTLRVDEQGCAFLEDPDLEIVSHMVGVSQDQALQLWLSFSSTGPDGVAQEPWIDGKPAVSLQEEAARRAAMLASLLESDREFYDCLSAENPLEGCRTPGCGRGRVALSVFCRVHHFEMIRGRPCPFDY